MPIFVSEEKEIMDPLFPPDLFTPIQVVLDSSILMLISFLDFNHFQQRYGAWILYAIGSLVTAVAAVIINNRS